MSKLNTAKKLDLVVVFLLLIGAAAISVTFRTDIIFSVFLYLGVPALYLWFRERKNWKKISFASLVIGIFLGMSWNLVAEQTNAWTTHYTFSPFNILFVGKMPLGEFVWGFLILFYTIIFYEHFLDDERKKRLSPRSTLALGVGMVSFFLTSSLLVNAPEQIHLQYSYLILGILICIPLVLLLWADLKLLLKVFYLSIFFFLLNLTFEITAIAHNQWGFPGNYIGTVRILAVNFPIEEMVFWIVLATPSLILCYEFLFDDGK